MRGITPIIAIIILLLITVSAAGAAFLWIQLVQDQVAEETQAGLQTSLIQMHGRLSIESVWNNTNQLCMILRNSGTHTYESEDLQDIGAYVGSSAYQFNTTTITNDLDPQNTLVLCFCTTSEAGSANCTGPTDQGYDYQGEEIDISIEPPAGTGDTYSNYQSG